MASVAPGSEARPLMMLSDAELWAEYIAEGVAPPSFVREDLVAMLAAVRSWREAPRAELVKLCRRNGVQGAQRMQEQELCLRLKQMTWATLYGVWRRFGELSGAESHFRRTIKEAFGC